MPPFTKQEQLALIIFSAILLIGSVVHYALKRYPGLDNAINIIEADIIYKKVDINSATHDELIELPYIGSYTATNILNYRKTFGPFRSHEEIKSVKGIRDKNYQKFLPYLKRIAP